MFGGNTAGTGSATGSWQNQSQNQWPGAGSQNGMTMTSGTHGKVMGGQDSISAGIGASNNSAGSMGSINAAGSTVQMQNSYGNIGPPMVGSGMLGNLQQQAVGGNPMYPGANGQQAQRQGQVQQQQQQQQQYAAAYSAYAGVSSAGQGYGQLMSNANGIDASLPGVQGYVQNVGIPGVGIGQPGLSMVSPALQGLSISNGMELSSMGMTAASLGQLAGWAGNDVAGATGQLTGGLTPRTDASLKPGKAVFIGNVADTVSETDVRQLAQPFGTIESIRLMRERHCAFVNFQNDQSALQFMAMGQQQSLLLGGVYVQVNWAKERPPQSERGAGAGNTNNEPSRSVYLGNVPDYVTTEQIEAMARDYGAFTSIRLMRTKHCAFINFNELPVAVKFYREGNNVNQPFTLGGSVLSVGYAKEVSATRPAAADTPSQPSRAVYLGNVPDEATEPEINTLALTFGQVSNVRLMKERHCAFINFEEVASATAMMTHGNATGLQLAGVTISIGWAKELSNKQGQAPGEGGTHRSAAVSISPSRSVYLGGLSDVLTVKDLCVLANQYGAIENLRVMPEKRCAFINFVDEDSATALFKHAQTNGISLRDHHVSVGYAKSTPLSPQLQQAISQGGATRNLHVSNLSQNVTEALLCQIFGQHCLLEGVVLMHAKGYAFVNTTSVQSAVTAMGSLQSQYLDGKQMRIRFAKEMGKGRAWGTQANNSSAGGQQQTQQGQQPKQEEGKTASEAQATGVASEAATPNGEGESADSGATEGVSSLGGELHEGGSATKNLAAVGTPSAAGGDDDTNGMAATTTAAAGGDEATAVDASTSANEEGGSAATVVATESGAQDA